MKKILLILFLISTYLISSAQDIELSPKEINTVKMLRATLFLINDHGPLYLDSQAFKYERTEEGHLLMSAKSNAGLSDPIIGDRYHSYLIKVENSFPIIEFYKEHGCREKKGFINITEWDEDRPRKTGSRIFDDGEWFYDSNGNIIELNKGQFYTRSGKKKRYKEAIIKFGYDEAVRLNEATEILEVYRPSSSSKGLKTDYVLKKHNFKFNYGVDQTTLEIDEYRQGKRGREKIKELSYILSSEGFQTLAEKETTNYKNGNAYTFKSLVKKDYDPYWRLSRRYSEEEHYVKTTDYIYDQHNRVLKKVLKTIQKDKNKTTKDITTSYQYKAEGLVAEETIIEKEDGNIVEKKVIKYEYAPLEEGAVVSKCEHKQIYTAQHYDQNDILFKEVKDNQVRVKKDGVWGEWQFFRM